MRRLDLGVYLGAVACLTAAPAAAHVVPSDRAYEGDWYVVDDTDNNTGERKVYALQLHLKRNDYVTLTMRCTDGKPIFFIDWDGIAFPDKSVITIAPEGDAGSGPKEAQYVFEKSTETTERGLRASSEISASIIAAIGQAKYVAITAHLPSGGRTVDVEVTGTQGAWTRVSRHCPVRLMQRPPL